MTDKEKKEKIRIFTEQIQAADPEREFEIIKIFQKKWHTRVLFELEEKSPRRFGELSREVPGISNAVLSNVLRSLEDEGFVERVQFNEIPPHVEYSLTDSGHGLLSVFYEMLQWESIYRPESFR